MGTSVENFNSILRLAGISSADLNLVNCADDGPCRLMRRENKKTEIVTAGQFEDLFTLANDWVARNPTLAKNHFGNNSKLFQPLNRSWIWVDRDVTAEADDVLFRAPNGEWKYLPGDLDTRQMDEDTLRMVKNVEGAILQNPESEKLMKEIFQDSRPGVALVKFLEKATWQDLGLHAGPEEFGNQLYPFEVSGDAKAPPFLSPFHQVNLTWHPEVPVPWSDPYLWRTYEAFLEDAGVEVRREIFKDGFRTRFFFRDLLMMEVERTSEKKSFRLFKPLGDLDREMSISLKPAPPIEVSLSGDVETQPSKIKIYGHSLEVWAHFPPGTPPEKQKEVLETLGATLQGIPQSMLEAMLTGVDEEKPIKVVLADKGKAKGLGLEPSENSEGNYHAKTNTAWIELGENSRAEPLHYFHEIGGHAYSDFLVPEINARSHTSPNHSALRDYYVWKLGKIFNWEDLKNYDAELESWSRGPKIPPLPENLGKFRERVLKKFLSTYAAEGPNGFAVHIKEPSEDFAEVMQVFFECLNGKSSFKNLIQKEPLLQLAGMDYLFREYGVASIGRISREEVYSKKAFEIVAHVDLEKLDPDILKVYGLVEPEPKPLKPSGFIIPAAAGYQWIRQSTSQGVGTAHAGYWGIFPGYRKNTLGAGLSLEFYHFKKTTEFEGRESATLWDFGVWGQWAGQAGPLHLFFEPALGLRQESSESGNPNSLWIGANAGVGFFGNSFGVKFQTKTDVTGPAASQNLGVGVFMDLPALIRFSARQN